jgi:hypothetical protein
MKLKNTRIILRSTTLTRTPNYSSIGHSFPGPGSQKMVRVLPGSTSDEEKRKNLRPVLVVLVLP